MQKKLVILGLFYEQTDTHQMGLVIKELGEKLPHWDIKIFKRPEISTNHESENTEYDSFNDMVLDLGFYDNLSSEYSSILFYQPTAMMINHELIHEFLDYDIVVPRRTAQGKGMRGLLLIKREIAISILTRYNPSLMENMDYWEYYSNEVIHNEMNLKVPSTELRKQFSVESLYNESPFAAVDPMGYLSFDEENDRFVRIPWEYTLTMSIKHSYARKLLIRQNPLDYYKDSRYSSKITEIGGWDKFVELYFDDTNPLLPPDAPEPLETLEDIKLEDLGDPEIVKKLGNTLRTMSQK